ncbi:RNA 2',3'-cyclic phosphodiesterase [Cellulomonas sp. JZ18]|uniref:RNA 2',3'-cyclic phosphodiesterase n=1 Tax=Cellulomonas sp. JZ18 TaxID=2654191 RepID=UPI0012D45B85|nr:RNA 2',3'-cyclic phosphodiesterase [Cellulomonas sp. JZ18]QGQ19566.1 RNA 2',3'-cyclic phosphodiesterase [Cellulomonas sp. JZ18]
MRLFAAVWPPADVLDHLDLALAAVRPRGGPEEPVRWTARDAWHLTAAFYGAVPDALADDLAADLEALAGVTAPFELALRGAGVFSHRTLWVGVGGDVDAMSRLSAGARAVGDALGARPDDRPRNRPHLTVGRARPGSRPPRRRGAPHGARGPGGRTAAAGEPDPVDALAQALAVYDGPAWQVAAVTLVESRPGEGRGGGPLYRTVGEWALGG